MRETYKISRLKNWNKNPRSIKKDAFERLKKQIQKLGQYKPLLITPDGTVLGGNMRLRAYKDLGITDIWVSIVEPKTESEMMEYSLSDNDRAGFYDEDLLANIMPELELDMSMYAVDLEEPTLLSDLDSIGSEEIKEDEAPAVSEAEPESKLGEVYQLGRHRLMCGDSTDAGSIALLMNGQKADMVFTSPPYNSGNQDGDGDYYKDSKDRKPFYKNDSDDKTKEEYSEFLIKTLKNIAVFCEDETPVLWNVAYNANSRDDYGKIIFSSDNPFTVKETIIWDKNSSLNIASKGILGRVCEFVFLMSKGENYQTNQTKNDCWFNVWRISSHNSQQEDHLACFPILLPVEALNRFSKENQIMLDPFSGSGSCMIACEQTNRICYMMEIDPHYCDVIRKRYAKFIGKEDEWLEVTHKA